MKSTTRALSFIAFACSTSLWAGPAEMNKEGIGHLQAGRYLEAEAAFTEASKSDPNNATFRNNIGVALQEQARFEDSIVQFKAAIDMKDGVALYHKNLGNAYLALGKLDDALESYRTALRINPAEPNLHPRIVDVAFELGTLDKWLDQFDDMISKATPEGAKGVNLVFLPEQAILYGHSLLGDHDIVMRRASAALEQLGEVKTTRGGYVVPIVTPFFFYIKRVPKSQFNITPITASLLGYRGRAYLDLGLLDEAAADFQRSLELAPRGSGGIGLGVVQLEKGDAKEAAYQLRRAVEAQPAQVTARLYYAAALHLTDDKKGAEEQVQMVVRKRGARVPRKGELEYQQALAYLDFVRGDLDKAAERFEAILDVCPTCGKAYRRLAEVRLKQGDNAKAGELLAKAAKFMPDDPRTKALLASLNR